MAAQITPINGRMARASFNGQVLNFDDCNVIFSTTTGEITGVEDQNAPTGRVPVRRTDGTDDFKGCVSGFIDAAIMPASAAQPFTQGAILTNIKIFLDKNTAARWAGTTRAIVRQVTYHPKQTDVAQRVSIEIENAGGTITHPT